MSVWQRLRTLVGRMREQGPRPALQLAVHRAYSAWCERRLGVDTAAFEPTLADEGLLDADFHGYSASSCLDLDRVLARVTPRPQDEVLLDFGSGLGRVVLMAARRPFRRVIGVEISPRQVEQARRNLERARPRLACRDVELICANAAEYVMPDDVTVVYLFNPFGGEVLRGVIRGIRRSLAARPRRVRIVVATARRFDEEVAGQDWIVRRGELHGLREHVIYETTGATA
jgi:cyclopropane fatty-acyl-phospholipid synthase-like methyltransferase